MKYVPLAFAAACLAGALTIVVVAPAHAGTPRLSDQLSKAIPAWFQAGPAEIRTADPAKTPG